MNEIVTLSTADGRHYMGGDSDAIMMDSVTIFKFVFYQFLFTVR